VPDPDGKGLLVLLVDAAKKKVEVVHLVGDAVVGRLGRFAEKPAETDDTLGAGARAIALDKDGNLWVTTNAWGATSVFQHGDDGAPFEASVVGPKGALKKFSLEGRLLGTVSLLEAPMDMALATADGTPVVLVSYRSVSEYHGAQVREGTMIVRTADAQRIGEIKASAGSIAVDGAGRLWIADVAGHVVCTDLRGKKAFDVAGSPAPAVMDARLPAASPLPVVVRSDGKGGVWVLFTLGRKLAALDARGMPAGDARPVADPAGAIFRMAVTPQGPIAIGDKGLWK
jgi:sugar lactone lactonase YvrE